MNYLTMLCQSCILLEGGSVPVPNTSRDESVKLGMNPSKHAENSTPTCCYNVLQNCHYIDYFFLLLYLSNVKTA